MTSTSVGVDFPGSASYKSPKKSARDAASQTAKEYGEASSLHGIQYIFERGQSLLLSRLFWLLVVIAGVCVGVFWSVEAYQDWQDSPVLTTVRTTGMPISEIDFPAITICSQGSISEVYNNVAEYQFNEYVKSNGKDPYNITEEEKADLKDNMTGDLYPGLDKDPKFLADSMSATTSPEKAAEANVLVSGGFDPCQYEQTSNETSNETLECEFGWRESINSEDNSSSYLDDQCFKLLDSKYPSPFHTSPVSSNEIKITMFI